MYRTLYSRRRFILLVGVNREDDARRAAAPRLRLLAAAGRGHGRILVLRDPGVRCDARRARTAVAYRGIHIHTYMQIYIHIYIERERDSM